MIVCYCVLAYIVLVIAFSYNIRDKQLTFGRRHIDNDSFCLFFIAVCLVLVSGLRYRVGTDYLQYSKNYSLYKEIRLENFGCRIVAVIASWINDDYSTWFFLMALITIGLCLYSVSKQKENWQLAVILYLFMGYWHSSFNIVKQSLAMAILLSCQNFLFSKKFVKWAIACIIAALFHVSAVIMIPIYFLLTRKVTKRQIILIVFVGVFISVGYEQLFRFMDILKLNDGSVSLDSDIGTRQVNSLRVLVNVIPALFIIPLWNKYSKYNFDYTKETITGRTSVIEQYGAKLNVWSNFALLNAVLCVATHNSVYLSRFCYYTGIFNLFFVPFALKEISLKGKRIIYGILLVCFFLYWSYDLFKGSTTVTFHWIFER